MSKNTLIVVACPGRGAGNDPEVLGSAFHQDPAFIVAYCQAIMIIIMLICSALHQIKYALSA